MFTTKLGGMQAFWLVWTGLLFSFTASGLTRFGLSTWVFRETQDAQAFSALLFFATIPLAIGSLVAGPLVDRWNRRTVMMASNFIASIPTLAVFLLYQAGSLELWHLYGALFVNGLAMAFLLPAFEASIRMLVPSDRLARASGMSQIIQSLGTIVAPPLAGLLVIQAGLGTIFIIDFVTVLLSTVLLFFVAIPQPPRTLSDKNSSVWSDFMDGLRYIAQRPPFVILIVYLTLVIFAQSFVYALSGPLVLSFSTEVGLGLVYGAFGVGGLIGALAIGITGGTKRRMHGILICGAGMGTGALIAGLRPDVALISVGVLLFGMAMSALISLNRTIYQERAAPEVLGRVFALRVVVGVGAQALGLLLAGSLAANVFEPAMREAGALAAVFGDIVLVGAGRGAALLILGTGMALLVLAVAAAAVRSIRHLEDYLPAPVEDVRPAREAGAA